MDILKKIDKYLNEDMNFFKEYKKDQEETYDQLVGDGIYDKKKVDKLKSIKDPKKWLKYHKRLGQLSKWDIPDELLKYL